MQLERDQAPKSVDDLTSGYDFANSVHLKQILAGRVSPCPEDATPLACNGSARSAYLALAVLVGDLGRCELALCSMAERFPVKQEVPVCDNSVVR